MKSSTLQTSFIAKGTFILALSVGFVNSAEGQANSTPSILNLNPQQDVFQRTPMS
ncbi:MAG: hypothetical protein ACREP9_20545 [Candidatus Dormibacteraceae bacterium]